MKENGFVLITVLLLLALLSVTALALNSRVGLQTRMSLNQSQAMQAYLGQVSALEHALWRLGQSPGWRTAGEAYTYQGTSFTRAVADRTDVSGYADSFVISATSPGGAKPLRASFRFYMDTPPPFVNKKPYDVTGDLSNNLYVADVDSHSVWRIDGASGVITRAAGNGTSGYDGDNGPASLAQLNSPSGVCTDQWGNLYVADTGNNRIRKLSSLTNIATTVVGTGPAGSSGDGGPATSAQLNEPTHVFVDTQGNLFIADTGNHKIRRVDASTGTITTIAGTGASGFSGDGGQATAAKLNRPRGLYVDSARMVYFSDLLNHVVRRIDATGVITTVAGRPGSPGYGGDGGSATQAYLNLPHGLCLDQAGNMYIVDRENNCIRKVDSSGRISTFAGNGDAGYRDGWATWAEMDHPRGVWVKSTGEVFVADAINCTIRKVASNMVSTVSITPGLGLSGPSKVAARYDATAQTVYLYIADSDNNRIRRLDTSSNSLTTVAGTGTAGYWGDGGSATSAALNDPGGISLDSSGNLYIADSGNCAIRKVDASSGRITLIAGQPQNCDFNEGINARFNNPRGLFISSTGDIYVADNDNHRIRKFRDGGAVSTIAGTGTAGFSGDGGPATSARLNHPAGVHADPSGTVYIADGGNGRVRKIDLSGNMTTITGADSLGSPSDVVVDGSGALLVADSNNHSVYLVSGGTAKVLAGTPPGSGFNGDDRPAANGRLNGPSGVALAGNRGAGRIYIGDTANNRIRVLTLRKVKELW